LAATHSGRPARALELKTLAADAKLATNAGRVKERARVVRAIAERVATRPAAEWMAVREAGGVACGVVKRVREALREVEASALSGVAPQAPGALRLAPPRLDEHGKAVRAAGWDAFRSVSS